MYSVGMATEEPPMKLTFAKEQCARCEKKNVPLVFESTGRLVCKVCLPIVERRNEEMRGERRRQRSRSLVLAE
jgi:hypothetical protein